MFGMREQLLPTAAATVKAETSLSDDVEVDSHPMTASAKKNKNTRRFSDEQIKFLEYMFESESRPESRTKQQLAKRVGLNPRQVAIWFQNRRARLKTKQIERDYNILKASYDILVSKFESLKSENQSLRQELQRLKNLPEKLQDGSKASGSDDGGRGCDGTSEDGDAKFELKEKPRYLFEDHDHKLNEPVDNRGKEIAQFDRVELTDASLSSSENWCSFESSCFLDDSSSSSQWWDFWS